MSCQPCLFDINKKKTFAAATCLFVLGPGAGVGWSVVVFLLEGGGSGVTDVAREGQCQSCSP